MQIEKMAAIVEALLFSMGEALSVAKIAEILEIDQKTMRRYLEEIRLRYEAEDRGIRLTVLEDAYQLCTKTDYYEYIRRATTKVKKYELSDVLLETLSIIAYKQPITKAHIEAIRGVKTDHAVNRLIEYGLVEEKGRLDVIGKPIVFGTTEAFLRFFGLSSPEDLPKLEENILDQIKREAENELQIKLEELE